MNEIDVIKTIAAHLTERKKSAALSNYKVLCNVIRQANGMLNSAVETVERFRLQLEILLAQDENVLDSAKDPAVAEFHFRQIVPTIIANDLNILHKFADMTRPDNRRGVTLESIDKLNRGFIDFNNLLTTVRQFFDSLVANAYQLVLLDPRETNYQVLQSLRSFYNFATRSLVQSVFDPELEDSLREFESLTIDQQIRGDESNITKSSVSNFKQRVGVLFQQLGLTDYALLAKIDSVFKFSSDFTHIGYVSTHLVGSDVSQVVFCDDEGPYLPNTENFSELKYEVIAIANRFLTDVYLPSLVYTSRRLIV
jgi:hypothetical protein